MVSGMAQPCPNNGDRFQAISDILTEAARPQISETIEMLRKSASAPSQHLSREQLQSATAKVSNLVPLDDVVDSLSADRELAVNEIAQFGAWVAQTFGKGDVEFAPAKEQMQMTLLPEAGDRVALHNSYAPSGFAGREIRNAVKALVTWKPTEEVVSNFLLKRAFSGATSILTMESLMAFTFFVRNGRLDDIAEVNPQDAQFHSVICAAYDLLEVGRQDALNGLQYALGLLEPPKKGTSELAIGAARVVFRDEITEIDRAASLSDKRLLPKTKERLTSRVINNPEAYTIRNISEFSETNVLAMASHHGLNIEVDQKTEMAARELLRENGIEAGQENFLPYAVRAVLSGTTDEYVESLQRERAAL